MRDDREDGVVQHFRSMDRFVASHIALAFFLNDGSRKRKLYLSIENSPFVVHSLMGIIALKGGDLIAEELCFLRSPMSNERFGLGKFQIEAFFEKLPNLACDLFCLLASANIP